MRTVQTSTASVATSTQEGARVSSEAAKASQAQSFQLNQLGSTLGLVGQAAGRFNPQLGQMATAAGAATGVIQTLSTSALGPLGFTIGVVTAAAGILAPAIAHMGEEADRAAERIRNNLNRSLTDFISDARSARENAALLERTRQGFGTAEEQGGLAGHRRAVIDARAAELTSALGELGLSGAGNQADLERQLSIGAQSTGGRAAQFQSALLSLRALNTATDQYERSLRQVDEATRRENDLMAEHTRKAKEDAAASAARADANRRHGGGARGAAAEDNDAANLRAKAIREEIAAQERELELARMLNNEHEKALEFARAQAEEAAAQIASEKELLAAKQAAAEAALAAEKISRSEAKADETRDAIKALLGDAQVQFTEFANAAGSAIVTAFQSDGGAKAFVAALSEQAKGLAKLELGKGIAAGAEALGLAIFDPPGAALKAAEAGEHFAAAAVFGGIGAAAGGGRGTSSGTTSRPEPSSNAGGGGEQKTVVINYGGDVITAATHAELGRTIRGLVEIGDARLGRG